MAYSGKERSIRGLISITFSIFGLAAFIVGIETIGYVLGQIHAEQFSSILTKTSLIFGVIYAVAVIFYLLRQAAPKDKIPPSKIP